MLASHRRDCDIPQHMLNRLERFRRLIKTSALVLGIGLTIAGRAGAQTGPELLVKTWPKGELFEGQADATFLNDGHTEHGNEFQLGIYQASGRVRLYPTQRADPRFGFDTTLIDVHTNDPGLPSKLVDTSVAFGIGVADNDGWLAGLSLGVGYAGAGAYDDSNAYYGKADFAIGKQLDERTSVGIVLDYNGNRGLLPDVPLVGFEYRKQIYEKLQLAVGFPFQSIVWTPNDEWTFTGRYIFPDGGDARVDYSIVKQAGVFVSYASRIVPFHDDELAIGHDRLIYEYTRAEVGARFTPIEQVNVIGAVGYIFSQEFNQGWDTRDVDRVSKPSDEPYLRVGVEVKF